MIQLQIAVSAVYSLFFFLAACNGQDPVDDIAKASNDSLLWGPYRSNLYFGVRPRLPKSLMTGLLWARVDSFDSVQHSTSVCPSLPSLRGFC